MPVNTTLPPQLVRKLKEELPAHLGTLESLFKDLHGNPELSCQEEKTAARVAAEFTNLGLEVHTDIGGHGLVGVLDNGVGPCVLLRADMDALPLKEQSGLPYASRKVSVNQEGRQVPVMHACGHDLHTTCLVGAAHVLLALRDSWRGKVLFIGQPAEETIGGAALMMKEDIYQRFGRPDHGLALHADPFHPAGSVALSAGVQSSCNHTLDITVRGIGGHGASPHQTRDPILLAAHIVTALQHIVSREIDPAAMGVITVGAIHGGTKRNIIPEEVVLNCTIRAFEQQVADQLLEAARRTACGLAQAHGLPEELWPLFDMPEPSFPPVINDPELTARARRTFTLLLGDDKVKQGKASNGSEDFSFFASCHPPVPLLMYRLGVTDTLRLRAAKEGGAPIAPVHDPRFRVDIHPSLATGVLTMSGGALALLELPGGMAYV